MIFLLPTVTSCLILSPLRFLFFSFMVNLPSSATISPPLLLLSPPPKPLRPSFPPLLSFTSLPPFSVYPSLSHAFLKKIYPSSPPVLFIALHFLYRHSSACCITPEIHPPPFYSSLPVYLFPWLPLTFEGEWGSTQLTKREAMTSQQTWYTSICSGLKIHTTGHTQSVYSCTQHLFPPPRSTEMAQLLHNWGLWARWVTCRWSTTEQLQCIWILRFKEKGWRFSYMNTEDGGHGHQMNIQPVICDLI